MESVRDALQPVLQPITHNLPAPIRDLGVSLIGDKCYSSLVLDIDVADEGCLKLAVSKALGVGIVAASSVVKVPQIVNLARSRSASGVSFLSYLLETSSYLISLAYNVRNGFPFSTYGETALILGQNVVITVLVLNYSGRAGFAALFVAALAGAVGALFTEDLLDAKTMGLLQAGAGTLGVASKLPQILAIWQEGGTGQLSAFTVSLSGPANPEMLLVVTFPRQHVFARAQKANLTPRTGLQLLARLAGARLYNTAGGGRQADPVQLRRGLCTEPRACSPDAVLLEPAIRQGAGEAEREGPAAHCRVLVRKCHHGLLVRHGYSKESADDAQARMRKPMRGQLGGGASSRGQTFVMGHLGVGWRGAGGHI